MCILDEYEKLEAQMSEIKIPYICYHGDSDMVVPKEGSQMLQEKSCSIDKTLAVSRVMTSIALFSNVQHVLYHINFLEI